MGKCIYIKRGGVVKCEFYYMNSPTALTQEYRDKYCLGGVELSNGDACPIIGLNSLKDAIKEIRKKRKVRNEGLV